MRNQQKNSKKSESIKSDRPNKLLRLEFAGLIKSRDQCLVDQTTTVLPSDFGIYLVCGRSSHVFHAQNFFFPGLLTDYES